MALFPSCAWAYRKGYIKEDPDPLVAAYTAATVHGLPKKDQGYAWAKYTPYDKQLDLTHSIVTDSYRASADSDFSGWPAVSSGSFTTSTDETNLDTGLGLLKTSTPDYCAITGFLADAPGATAGTMKLVQASDFGSITWVSLVGSALPVAKRSLLTIVSKQQNTGMIWDGTTTVHDNWGSAPTLQNPLTVHLQLSVQADYLHLYPLSPTGQVSSYTTVQPSAPGVFDITIDQNQSKTLWYGVEAFGSLVTATAEPQAGLQLTVTPNPVQSGVVRLQWSGVDETAPATIRILDLAGKTIWTSEEGAGIQQAEVPVARLYPGCFIAEVTKGGRTDRKKLIVQ
jgi:hypothetical protein